MSEEQDILTEARNLVLGDRQDAYGDPYEHDKRTAALWSALLGFDVPVRKVALMMIAEKLGRETYKPKKDNLRDIIGYAWKADKVVSRITEAADPTKLDLGDTVEGSELIYLASPYSPTSASRKFTDALTQEGRIVFSPIVHSHPQALAGLKGDWKFWETIDTEWIKKCDRVMVLMLDGWKDSVGVRREIELAKDLDKPVEYVEPCAET